MMVQSAALVVRIIGAVIVSAILVAHMGVVSMVVGTAGETIGGKIFSHILLACE